MRLSVTYRIWLAVFSIVCLLLSNVFAMDGDQRSSYQKIEDAYRAGSIDRSQLLVAKATAFFEPENLPVQFKSSYPSPLKSGSGLIEQILEDWDSFDEQQQNLLAGYMVRPNLAEAFDSPGGFFKIHFDRIGSHEVPPEDLDEDSIPDYVERIAKYCDSAFSAYTTFMGYYPAPSDGDAGGDDKYDIYLENIGGYGITYPGSEADSAWDDYSSFIGIHHDFYGFPPNNDPEGDTIGAQKVTCAHEYFHATQLAYDRFEELWWKEGSATWMEEVVFPEVDDNYNFLTYFFSEPQTGLTSSPGLHQYGAFVWAGFLYQRFEPSIIRSIWEECRFSTTLDATNLALAAYGTNVMHIFPEFTVWNYYTGDRAIPGQYYADAADYPQVVFDQDLSTLAQDSLPPINGPDGLACNYLYFDVDSSARGILEILLEGSELVRWASAGIISAGGFDTVQIGISQGSHPISLYHPFIEDYNSVVVVPSVVTPYLEGNNYYLSNILLPYGDANYDKETNVADAIYMINYVFKNGPAPQPVIESGDANCDGDANIADAVKIINYVFNDGEAPCADR